MWNPFKRHVCDSVILRKYMRLRQDKQQLSNELYKVKEELAQSKLQINTLIKYPNRNLTLVKRIAELESQNYILRCRAQGQEDQWLREEAQIKAEKLNENM